MFTHKKTATERLYALGRDALLFFELRGSAFKDGFPRGARFVEIGDQGVWYQGNATADYIYFTNAIT